MSDKLPPVHPGEMLTEDFLGPLGVTVARAAAAMRVEVETLQAVADHRAPVTAELAMRLERCIGWSVDMWLRVQNSYDRAVAEDTVAAADLASIECLNPAITEPTLAAAE